MSNAMYAPAPLDMWNWAIAQKLTPIPIAAGTKVPLAGYMWKDAIPSDVFPHGTQSVAIRCCAVDATAALDFDCDCGRGPQYLTALQTRLGNQMAVRFGRPGRFLIPFRVTGPFEAHDFKLPCGCKVQVLHEKYFLAAGNHPDTGLPYMWVNISSPWPQWSYVQALGALAFLGTDVTNSTKAEAAHESDLQKAEPKSAYEKELIRKFAMARLGDLTNELRGTSEGRGSLIFQTTAVVAPAVLWGCIAESEIETAVGAAGHSLDDKRGGRTLGQEILRALQDPIRAGNPVLSVALRNRELHATVAGMMPDGRTTLDRIMDTTFEPLRFVVDGLLPEGLIFLVGDPKIGKSFITLELALSVAESGTFWGRACAPGDVVYFMLEDSPRRVKRRVEALRPGGHAKGKVHVFTQLDGIKPISLQPGVAGFLEHLEAFLDQNPGVKLVIVDTLINIRPDKRDKTQQLYQADYESVAGLQRLIAKRGLTCVCVHHTRKSAEVDSITERMSGSNGLHGAGDGAWFVTKKNGLVMFNTSMRDAEEVEMQLVKDDGALVWKPIEGNAPVTKPGSVPMQHILNAVMAAGCEASPADVSLRTNIPAGHVHTYMKRLADRSELERTAHGMYKIASTAAKTRPVGARDILANAANGGAWDEYQAGKVVDAKHVLHIFKNTPPTDRGYAVSPSSAKTLLSAFHEPDKLLRELESLRLAFQHEKVLLIPYETPVTQVAAAPSAPMPWEIKPPVPSLAEEMAALHGKKLPWA